MYVLTRHICAALFHTYNHELNRTGSVIPVLQMWRQIQSKGHARGLCMMTEIIHYVAGTFPVTVVKKQERL